MSPEHSMTPIARQVAHLANRAATRAVAHASAAQVDDRAHWPLALETAVQADDAAVRALHAARHRRHAELFGHLAVALEAERRARRLELEAADLPPVTQRATA